MIDVSQRRTIRVAPAFGIEMQAKDKIGMQHEVYTRRPAADFTIPVEQNFALSTDGLLFRRIIWIKNVGARLWHPVLN